MRYLAVDPGARRMGFAVGNDLTGTASPLAVVPYGGVTAAARRIADTAERLGADRIVLGLPTLADGSVGPAGRRSERLAEELSRLGLDAVLQGEFLSTDEARHRAKAAGRPTRQAVDDLAAQVILEEYLAGLENRPRESGQ